MSMRKPPAFVEPVDQEPHFLLAERRALDLPVGAALLEALAFDLDHARPPLWVALHVREQLPDPLDRSLDERLLAGM